MSQPKTLLEMAGAPVLPADLTTSTLVLIDCQREYETGHLILPEIKPALNEIKQLLDKARSALSPIVHIVHQGRPGSLFDLDGEGGKISADAMPQKNEVVVKKTLPNSFAGSDLQETLQKFDRPNLIFAGFMTHMCVSSTVRGALDLGYTSWVVDKATATRDLPTAQGGVIKARDLHNAVISGLADRFATIVEKAGDVKV